MSASGSTIRSQSQSLILNLLEYFEREKINNGPLIPFASVQERVADALKISLSSVKRIKSRAAENPVLRSPGKKRPRKKSRTSDLPEATKMIIRNTVYNMYIHKKHVTVQTLNNELHNNHILLSNSSLNRVLHEIGFKFKKDSNRRALMEKFEIAEMRVKFLKSYMQHLESPTRDIIFIDETWIFSKGSAGRSWQDDSTKSVRKPEGYDGKRFIVVHAGSKSGFVQNASLLFATKSKSEDYHGDMNGDIFLKWIDERLVSNLEEPSLIIMDNASYHSVVVEKMPTAAWKKEEISEWLTSNNIPFEPSMFKLELLELAKAHKKQKFYKVDELLRSRGHDVLRLPPYHCEFNAIEMIWAHAKSYFNKNIGRDGYGDQNVLNMWQEALEQCTEEVWRNCVAHTENVIRTWYEREKIFDSNIDDIIINLDDSSSSDEYFSSEED